MDTYTVVAALVLALAIILLEVLYLKPKRQMKKYDEVLRGLGYKTCVLPFSLINNSVR